MELTAVLSELEFAAIAIGIVGVAILVAEALTKQLKNIRKGL